MNYFLQREYGIYNVVVENYPDTGVRIRITVGDSPSQTLLSLTHAEADELAGALRHA